MDRCSVMLLWLTFSDFAICFLGSPRAEGQRVTDDMTAAPTNTKTERSLRIRVRTSPKTTTTTTSVDSFKMCTKKNKNKCTKSTFTSWHAALWASLCLACAMLKKVPVVLSKQPTAWELWLEATPFTWSTRSYAIKLFQQCRGRRPKHKQVFHFIANTNMEQQQKCRATYGWLCRIFAAEGNE